MIWIIGNKGMLGTEISLLLEKNKISFTGTDIEVDITSLKALCAFVKNKPINWIINCAAYTAVDKAEEDAEKCRLLNTLGAENIASCAKSKNAPLIHISTDYVFDGKGITIDGEISPYSENDETKPIGIYGLTKRDGELAVLRNNPSSFIIRTAWLYGKYGKNFADTMLQLMNERDEIKVVNDQRGSPTWTFDLASTILTIVQVMDKEKKIPFGIFNYTNEGIITWFDFANEIYKLGCEYGRITGKCTIRPCTSAEFPAKVKRPEYSALDKSKIKEAFGITIPTWNKSLRDYIKDN